MATALTYTVSFATACVLFLTASWYLDTSVPEDMPESLSATLLDAFCRSNWHIIGLLDSVGAYKFSLFWRETIFQSTLSLLVRGSLRPAPLNQDPELLVSDTVYADVPVRVYEPVVLTSKINRPVVLFFQGGWATLGLDIYDPIAREIAKKASTVVVAVKFQTPPQIVHPAAFEDCVKVTKHVIHQAHVHNFDPNRVAVAGDGAGAQLAAAVALTMKHFIKMQLFDLQTPSYIENQHYLPGMRSGGGLLSDWMRYGNIPLKYSQDLQENKHTSSTVKKSRYSSYLAPHLYTLKHIRSIELQALEKPNDFGEEAVSNHVSKIITDPLFAPLMADDKDFLHLPSITYIITAGYDVTRDDGLIYWRRLKNAGVEAHLAHYRDGFHNMLAFATLQSTPSYFFFTFSVGGRVVEDLVEFLLDNL
ncbi:arylacetamide deacetylase-like 4 [Plakobranchus ocellatus]|uniref:Arylacetamide deacetylase-like 4 n=1 Tax=Plakobranchus ocellatus TaxID=259542 RepID=A0AAV4A067_9GAST|nr:arylacetamide deacetylase-like 4 [Plakobranchus ocellatus]